eukprot:GGOE01004334.1.p1 GENE.GGOE01004334.1~~GGOE01004334.1.p1  ORF type:complete len:601 (+),score=219.51 GGOE01004334.1:26-1804(+)
MADPATAEPSSSPAQTPEAPAALQFITINEKGDSFELREDVLRRVLDAVPEEMPVSVVCVVGAFRTGKSFLMDLFLRFLRSTSDSTNNVGKNQDAPSAFRDWLLADGTTLEGVCSESSVTDAPSGEPVRHTGFSWRPGNIRNTTGMWVWSQPFIRRNPLYTPHNPSEPEEVAVLLVDTQGMFDMMTAQMLTAAIFGLSTLISSYLVYNVEKRIQEDNLQHLALFTEYGRIALSAMQANAGVVSRRQPFQSLQFLVRDYQDFQDEDDVEMCMGERGPYLNQVLESAAIHKDLAEVREHINTCFELPNVFMLPHPGPEVTKKKYAGDLNVVSQAFCALVHHLAVSIFGTNSPEPTEGEQRMEKGAVVKKRVGDRFLTASELMGYVRNYVQVFHDAANGSGVFPEAKTLLAATAEANNFNAVELGLKRYRNTMDQICGAKQQYVSPDKIEETHEQAKSTSLQNFDRMATMGSKDKIVEFRERLEVHIQEMYEEYLANNLNKQPDILRFITVLLMLSTATYLTSSCVAIVCWPPSTLPFDFEYADMCNGTISLLRDVYITTFFFICITFVASCWNQIAPILQVVAGTQSSDRKKVD